MKNINHTIHSQEKQNNPEIVKARNYLLESNPDRLFGVYSLLKNTENSIELELIENILCMYPNQIQNLQNFDENSGISILDINALRKGEISYLLGKEQRIKNPILLSGGVIEIYGAKTKNGTRDHVLLTLRDGNGGADNEQYTSIAGRASGDNLFEENEREQAEESPFLLQNNSGEFFLGIKKLDENFIRNLENSIEDFTHKIRNADKNSEQYIQAEKYLQKLFPKVENLENLINILQKIVKNKNYTTYQYEDILEYPLANDNIKNIKLNDSEGKFFVFHDTNNNTIEYRAMERITGIPKNFSLAGRSTSRLYLESFNQRPNTISRTNKTKKLVPIMQFFTENILRK